MTFSVVRVSFLLLNHGEAGHNSLKGRCRKYPTIKKVSLLRDPGCVKIITPPILNRCVRHELKELCEKLIKEKRNVVNWRNSY